jgi:hypothetical protein
MRKITKDDVEAVYEGTVCPEQIWLYFGDKSSEKNKIGYIRLRFGILTLSPVVDGNFDVDDYIYIKRFLFDQMKGAFGSDRERSKYLRKCTRKIVRWYNRKHKNTPDPL